MYQVKTRKFCNYETPIPKRIDASVVEPIEQPPILKSPIIVTKNSFYKEVYPNISLRINFHHTSGLINLDQDGDAWDKDYNLTYFTPKNSTPISLEGGYVQEYESWFPQINWWYVGLGVAVVATAVGACYAAPYFFQLQLPLLLY